MTTINPRWNNAQLVEQEVWNWRLADLPRGENRTIIDQLFNGDPPYDEALVEENQIEINRNNLEGPNLMGNARRQWNAAMLKPGNFFTVTVHHGDKRKRREWGHTITKHANRILRKSRAYMEQRRQTGGAVMMHGIGPVTWETRRRPVPTITPIASVLIPSETKLQCDNLDRFAIFREYTPAQLYSLTHGPQRDPGWNMEAVQSQWSYVRDQVMKEPNATAFQYMPERIEELYKQDLGFWGSDAVPTIDCWDFYFKGDKDSDGWYRRIILDWGVTETDYKTTPSKYSKTTPPRKNDGDNNSFLYTSKNRRYGNRLEELLHFNFADCSCYTPNYYHSVRSLGWMLWGVCDLENRMYCQFNQAVFENLLWYFRVAGNAELTRLRKANFINMGVIPQGVNMVKADERYTPDKQLIEYAFGRNEAAMQRFAASFTQDFSNSASGREITATETMARVNTVNQLVTGLMQLSYEYEAYKDTEILRRLLIPHSTDRMAKDFRAACLEDGVPEEILNHEYMELTEERSLGAGNKTIEMAQVQFLQSVRKNLGPDAQRRVDHIAIESALDDAAMAEDLAPVDTEKQISNSMHDAQLATDRLMRGLPFVPRDDMVFEDYVKIWIADLSIMVQGAVGTGGMAKPEDILGWQNMAKTIGEFLGIMSQDPDEREKVRKYQEALTVQMNHVKAFVQRLQQQQKAAAKQNGNGGKLQFEQQKAMLEIQTEAAKAQIQLRNREQSHAQRTAQKQASFELAEQRKDRESLAGQRRKAMDHALDFTANSMRSLQE